MSAALITWCGALCALLLTAEVGVSVAAPHPDVTDVRPRWDNHEAMRKATLNEGSGMADLVEGDIRILPGTGRRKHHRGRRQMVNVGYLNFYATWPGGIVPYSISSSYQASSVAVIRNAMVDIEKRTCIKFLDVATYSVNDLPSSSLNIYSGGGCWSYIGNLNGGSQDLSLAEVGCIYKGVVQHELMHALGFVHTQSRPDRGQAVRVLMGNVQAGYEHNFDQSQSPVVSVQIPYDLFSVMHYGSADFSANSGTATLYPKSAYVAPLLGNRVTMSFYDEKGINALYGCSGNCQLTCQNDGYAHALNSGGCECRCPAGLGGPSCDLIDSQNYPCGSVVNLVDGTSVSISSPNYPSPYTTGRMCAWLVQAPPGRLVQISFKKMGLASDASKCRHFLDIRKNMLGQPSPAVYCGIGTPNDTFSSRDSTAGNKILIIFDASDTTVAAGAGFTLTVSSYTDGCLGDPCRGARCSSYPGSASYTCVLPTGDAYCGFETESSAGCKVIRNDGLYDDYSGNVAKITWDTASSDTSDTGTTAPEGDHYLSSYPLYNEYNDGSRCYGRFRILPFSFGTTSRCLRFKYYMNGNGVGSLLVYRAVNGALGTPIFKQIFGTSAAVWNQAQVTVSATGVPTDLIEVVFEAQHNSSDFDSLPIAIDDIRYVVGACGSGPCSTGPCYDGTQCAPSGNSFTCATPLPAGDVSSSFESWENSASWLSFTSPFELYSWVGPGYAWPRPTGARGPATGLTYLYARLYTTNGATATMKIRAFAGGLRCLTFSYCMYGMDMGSLKVNRVVTTTSGTVSTSSLWSKQGNQGDTWWGSSAITVNTTLASGQQKIEITIVARRQNVNYAADMALDDVSYTQGACSTSVAVGGPW